MSIRDGHNKKVSFDTREGLCYMIDKLVVMIGKLATRFSRTNDSSNPQFIKVGVEVRTEITIRGTIRTDTDQATGQVVVTEDNTDKAEVGLDTNNIIGEVI